LTEIGIKRSGVVVSKFDIYIYKGRRYPDLFYYLSKMYNSKYSSEEVETRSSMDPIFPPTAKLHDTDNRSSTVSIDVDTIKDTEIKPTRMERFKATLKILRPMAIMLFFDVGLPLAVYYILKIWLSILIALILSGIPPLLRVIYVFWKKRKVDILGCIFVVSFILSAVLSVISGK
jgi:hypothetical protein